MNREGDKRVLIFEFLIKPIIFTDLIFFPTTFAEGKKISRE